MEFALTIRAARKAAGLTQTDLAQRVGCGLQTIWDVEHGNGTIAMLDRIATTLGLKFAGLRSGRTFADRVKAARLHQGWSRKMLADRAGVSPMAVYRLEEGNARVKTLEAVINVLAPKLRIARTGWAARKPSPHDRDRRFTPPEFMEKVHAVMGSIDLDPAADRDSPVVASRYFYEEDDGLAQPWSATTVFCNPPYSKTTPFIQKAFAAWTDRQAEVIFMLLPARTQLHAFHECVAGHADVFLLKGRISFLMPGGGRTGILPFPNMIVIYGADEAMVGRVMGEFEAVHIPRG